MNFISMSDVREAEQLSRRQRINNARLLRFDETKCATARDVMLLHRVRAAAVDRSDAFDTMLGEPDVNRLFNDGAISVQK